MTSDSYEQLYYHAFNCLTDLMKQIQEAQIELEEMYLSLEGEPEDDE